MPAGLGMPRHSARASREKRRGGALLQSPARHRAQARGAVRSSVESTAAAAEERPGRTRQSGAEAWGHAALAQRTETAAPAPVR